MRRSASAKLSPMASVSSRAAVLGQEQLEVHRLGVETGDETRDLFGETLGLVVDGDDDGETRRDGAATLRGRAATRYGPGHGCLPFRAVCRKAR